MLAKYRPLGSQRTLHAPHVRPHAHGNAAAPVMQDDLALVPSSRVQMRLVVMAAKRRHITASHHRTADDALVKDDVPRVPIAHGDP